MFFFPPWRSGLGGGDGMTDAVAKWKELGSHSSEACFEDRRRACKTIGSHTLDAEPLSKLKTTLTSSRASSKRKISKLWSAC